MPFEHACFISYRHHEQSALAEKFIEELCAALRSELSVLIEEDIYIDRNRMRGGTFFNTALAVALCKSVCMIVVFTPTYFSKKHPYCAREFRAMETLEKKRLDRMREGLKAETGLIIPIVLRGEASLPAHIKNARHYYSFERFSLTSRNLSKNPRFEGIVREIAEEVYARKRMLDAVADDVCGDCNDFEFPTEAEIGPWLEAVAAPLTPFPLTAGG